jgi:hypothetical protein
MLHGHTPAEVLAYLSWRSDQQDQARARRDRGGVVSTVGIDVGPRPGRLRRLLGW